MAPYLLNTSDYARLYEVCPEFPFMQPRRGGTAVLDELAARAARYPFVYVLMGRDDAEAVVDTIRASGGQTMLVLLRDFEDLLETAGRFRDEMQRLEQDSRPGQSGL